jgi:hypothetical protein
VLGDFLLPVAQGWFTEHAEHFGAIGEVDLANAQARRFLEENLCHARGGDRPHLDRNRHAAFLHAHHGRMPVADRPEAINRAGFRFAHEGRARGEQVGVEFEPAHERAVDGEQDGISRVHGKPS